MNGPVQLEDIAEVCSTCYESVRDGRDKCSHTKVISYKTSTKHTVLIWLKLHRFSMLPHICRSGVWWMTVEKWKVFDLSQLMKWFSMFTAVQVICSMEFIDCVETTLHVNPGALLHMEIWSFRHGMVGPPRANLVDCRLWSSWNARVVGLTPLKPDACRLSM